MASSLGIPLLLAAAPARAQVVLSAFTLDQHVGQPSSSTTVTAYLSQPTTQGEWYIQSANITIDGVDHPATVGSTTGTGNGVVTALSYVWDSSSAGNPSEHTISASAQVQWEYEGPPSGPVDTINSTAPAYTAGGSTTAFYGDGRAADLVFADMRLKSIGFTGNIGITQNATTGVSTPEFTWDPAGGGSTASSPAAYVQGKTVGFTMTFCDSKGAALTGTATTGYTLKLQANPNGINAGTGQPVPSLTLYDNTTVSPVAPATFSGSMATVTATTALGSYVARYTTTLAPINLYVQFTHVTPTPTWGLVSSPAASGNTLYTVLATPTAPMATPWVPLLDYACRWATGSTDATSATTALTKAEYDGCTYNNGNYAHTDYPWQDGSETFHLQAMLNDGTGQCNDFADFLVCLSNAIGARPLKPQRSVTATEYANGSRFYTKAITAAHDETASDAAPFPGGWTYHQWANDGNILDGSLRFGGTTTPADLSGPALGTTYNLDLVSSYLHTPSTPDWDPQPPFVLTVVN